VTECRTQHDRRVAADNETRCELGETKGRDVTQNCRNRSIRVRLPRNGPCILRRSALTSSDTAGSYTARTKTDRSETDRSETAGRGSRRLNGILRRHWTRAARPDALNLSNCQGLAVRFVERGGVTFKSCHHVSGEDVTGEDDSVPHRGGLLCFATCGHLRLSVCVGNLIQALLPEFKARHQLGGAGDQRARLHGRQRLGSGGCVTSRLAGCQRHSGKSVGGHGSTVSKRLR